MVLLDRRLPDTDGLLLTDLIKATAHGPFIILSSLSSANDQVLGLGMGAQDYIGKPVEPAVLRARMEKHLADRAASADDAPQETHVSVGSSLSLNTMTRRLRIGEHTQTLSPTETRLLQCLADTLGKPLDRMQISMAICGREWVYGDRTVDVLVSRLRRRLRASSVKIVTVHGMGYALIDESMAAV